MVRYWEQEKRSERSMGKESVLPKNIRQIGDIRGREKICMEDYVMTYIRKKEPEEEQGYLGIFLGEKKQTEDSEYILIRGILEIPREDEKPMGDLREKSGKTNAGRESRKTNAEENTARENGKKISEENAIKESRKRNAEENAVKENGKTNAGENVDSSEESVSVSKNSADIPETLAEKIQKERRLYFPEWEIQGCCVIGTYPAVRMEELAKAVPESCSLLYHLQEQEENFYWMKNGQYQRIRGYFVFYEQNKLMQEYMSEVFGSNSVEKESQPDRAIRNFREKIAQKSEKKSRSMLKLASSFFVVTVLVVGAVVVNRIDDIRNMQSLPAEIGEYQAAEVVSSLNAALDDGISTETVGSTSASGNAADGGAVEANTGNSTASGVVLNNADSTPEQEALYLTDELAGSAAFWEEAYEDDAASADTVVSASADSTASEETAVSANTGSTASIDASVPASADSTIDTSAESALTAANNDSTAAELQTSQDVSSSTDLQILQDTSSSTDLQTSQNTAAADSPTAQDTSDDTDLPAAQEASSMRQTYAAYVIKEGDTLADICNRYYGDLNHLEEICEVNEIEDANRIMPGQKIVLP